MSEIWISAPADMRDLAAGIAARNASEDVLKFVMILDEYIAEMDFTVALRDGLSKVIGAEQ